MKRTAAIIVLLLIGTGLYAGSFFVNFMVIDSDRAQVEKLMAELNLDVVGIYDPGYPDHYLICEKISDGQALEYGIALCKKISRKLQSPVLITSVYDSDILIMVLIENGEETFAYDSCPGCRGGEGDDPEISRADSFCSLFDVKEKELARTLQTEYVFAEDILEQVIVLARLPLMMYVGYRYALEEKEELEAYGYEVKIWAPGKQ